MPDGEEGLKKEPIGTTASVFIVKGEIEIRECKTLDELAACVDLQREVFALPEIEISPVRHFVVTKNAGGFAARSFCWR